VGQVPRALPVDLDQLIADAKPAVQRGWACGGKNAVFSFRKKRKRQFCLLKRMVSQKSLLGIHMFVGLLDPDPLATDMDPDPSIIKQK